MKKKTFLIFLGIIFTAAVLSLILIHMEAPSALLGGYAERELEDYAAETLSASETHPAAQTLSQPEIPLAQEGYSDAAIAYPLTDCAREKTGPQECAVQALDRTSVTTVITALVTDDGTYAVVLTDSAALYAARETEDGYAAFYEIGDTSLIAINNIVLSAFSDVLGYDGVMLSCTVGANAQDILYFAPDTDTGAMRLLAHCGKRTDACGGMLWEQYGMGSVLYLYRAEDDGIYRYDLAGLLSDAYPAARQIYTQFSHYQFYGSHTGLVQADMMMTEDGQYARYCGWVEGDMLYLISWEDMVLPEYRYTPTAPETDETAYKWLRLMLGTDFGLTEETVPPLDDSAALETYMDEAYRAGYGILALYDIATDAMSGAEVWSSDNPAFFSGGRSYYDMRNPVFPSLCAWETYQRRILSAEAVDCLMARDTFIEVDGKLYGQMGARGTDITMTVADASVTAVSESDITYTVTVEIREDLEVVTDVVAHEFHYTKTDDGWRWTVLYIFN